MFALKDIYQNYSKDVYLYLVSLTHDPLLSEDLTSETFLGFIRSLPQFKGECDIKTYLFTIARRCFFKYLKGKRADLSYEYLTNAYIFEDNEFDNLVYTKQVFKRVLELIDAEPDRTKEIVKLRINGYSFYEINTKLHISEGSARVIDFRCKKKIKETLLKEGLNYE